VVSTCLFPVYAEKPHGFGAGFVFGETGSSITGALDDSEFLNSDISGYELYGKFGGKWGIFVSYRKVRSDGIVRDYEALLPQLQLDTECCNRAEYWYKALDFSFYRTWFPEKMWRPHAKIGWMFGDYDLRYWDLYKRPREDPADELIEILSETVTPRPKADSQAWDGPQLGLGFELGSQKYAFFFDAKAFNMDTIEAVFLDSHDDPDNPDICEVGEYCQTILEEDSALQIEVTFGFIYKFGFE
jgi:hypothetical protein